MTIAFSAYNCAGNYVKKSISSPSAGVFPNPDERVEHVPELYDGESYITTWVETEKNAGEVVRINFSCIEN